MHGKKREEYKAKFRDPKISKALSQKAEQWHVLMKELQGRRQSEAKAAEAAAIVDSTTLALLGKALLVNPDPMNLWNHRRELILNESKIIDETEKETEEVEVEAAAEEESKQESTTTAIESSIVHRERSLTTTALQRNPKAYGAWFHRKWILQKFKPSLSILEEELGLTTTFLMADERNFHCWNYRRFVVACLGGSWDGAWIVTTLLTDAGVDANNNNNNNNNRSLMGQQVVGPPPPTASSSPLPPTLNNNTNNNSKISIPAHLVASEFEFTTSKITQNFSNFSAFHYRSQLLDLHHAATVHENQNSTTSLVDAMEERLDQEFQLVEDAVCTEPDDQTCWWYHSILMDLIALVDQQNNTTTTTSDDDKLMDRFIERFHEQADLFRELLEDSPNSKWVILGLVKVLQILGTRTASNENENENEFRNESKRERAALLQKLQEIDPYRANRYEFLKH